MYLAPRPCMALASHQTMLPLTPAPSIKFLDLHLDRRPFININEDEKEFADSPAVRTWHFHHHQPRFNPWLAN